VRASWGFDVWLAGEETNAKGVAILFNPSFEYKIHSVRKDPKGCYIALDEDLMQKKTTLINMYGLSDRDNPEFVDQTSNLINQFGNDDIIIGGDWNCLMDMKIDSRNYTSLINRPRTRLRIKELDCECVMEYTVTCI